MLNVCCGVVCVCVKYFVLTISGTLCRGRLLGDLLYLDVVTAEGKNFCITAHTRGFYVNRSKGNILNAERATPAVESTTLVGLLRLLSKTFVSGYNQCVCSISRNVLNIS